MRILCQLSVKCFSERVMQYYLIHFSKCGQIEDINIVLFFSWVKQQGWPEWGPWAIMGVWDPAAPPQFKHWM